MSIFRKITSIVCILAFLAASPAYPAGPYSLRAQAFLESLTRRLEGAAGFFNPARERDTLPVSRADNKTGRRKTKKGECVATSKIIIPGGKITEAVVQQPAVRKKPAAVSATSGLLTEALGILANYKSDAVVKDVIARISEGGDAELPVEFLDDHDVLMDVLPASQDAQQHDNFRIRVDIDTARGALVKKYKHGLTVLMAVGLLHEFYHRAGLSEEDALMKVIDFCRVLDKTDTAAFNALTEVLRQKGIDHGNAFRRFILSGVKDISEQERRVLARQLINTWHRVAARDLLIFTKKERVALNLTEAEVEQRRKLNPNSPVLNMEVPRMDNRGVSIGAFDVGLVQRGKPTIKTMAAQAGDQRVAKGQTVVEQALGMIAQASRNGKFKKTIGEPLKLMVQRGAPLKIELVDDLDHLMDIQTPDGFFSAEDSRVVLRLDSRIIEDTPPQRQRGLAVMASMGMVFYFHRRLGYASLEAHGAMMDYFCALSTSDRKALAELINNPEFDCCGYLGNFLNSYPNMKKRTVQQRIRSDREIQILRARSLAGELPFDLERARAVLDKAEEEGQNFSTATNTALFNAVKGTFDEKKAELYYARLAGALREAGIAVTAQRGSRVAHTQGTILSAARFALIDADTEDASNGIFSSIYRSRPAIDARAKELGESGKGLAAIIDGFYRRLEIVEHDFEQLKESQKVPYAQLERLIRILEAERDKFLHDMNEEIANCRRRIHMELKGPLNQQRRTTELKKLRNLERALFNFRNNMQEGIDRFMSSLDNAEMSDIAFTFFIQRFSSRSGHHMPRLMLGKSIYIESDPEIDRIRTQALANIDMAPHPKFVVPYSSFYSENASLTVKISNGRPIIDWPNMEELLFEMAPSCYEAIKNAERNGWPMFTYQLETTVGGTYAVQVQKTLEQVMTDIATVEASPAAQKLVAEKKAAYAQKIGSSADIMFKRYILEGEIASVMEEEKVDREAAIAILLRKYRSVAEDVANLAVIREAGLEDQVNALVGDAAFQANISQGAGFEARLYKAAYAEVLKNRKDLLLRARYYIRNYVTYRDLTAARETIDDLGLDTRPYHVSSTGPNRRFNFVVKPSRVWFGKYEVGSVTSMYGQIISAEQLEALEGAFGLVQAVNSSIPCAHAFIGDAAEGGNAKVIENTVRDILHSLGGYVGNIVKAHGGDGRALRYAINSRKESHFLLWATTMVTGYCLTKEPIFIILMNEMTKDDLLGYLGVPQKHREHIKKEAQRILAARAGFISTAEWEEWAREELSGDQVVRQYFGDISDTEWVPRLDAISFLSSRLISEAAGTEFQSITNRIAEWATELLKIERQINDMACISAVNDIFEAVERARKVRGEAADVTRPEDIKIGMQGSYKADVSDYRESANWYMFLALTKQFNRLKNYMGSMMSRLSNIKRLLAELEESGRARVGEGFTEEYRALLLERDQIVTSPEYREFAETTAIIEAATAHLPIPGQIVFSDPYVPDADQLMDGTLKTEADAVKVKLKLLGFANFGIAELTDEQIVACAVVDDFGADLSRWPVLNGKLAELDRRVSPAQAKTVRDRIASVTKKDMVTLVSYSKDVGKDFFRDYQVCDVILLNSAHEELRRFISNLPRVSMCMRIGNPGSAMVLRDTSQQSQGPLLDYYSIMEWEAMGGTYSCADIHKDKIEEWRREMSRQRAQAALIHDAIARGDKVTAQRLLTDLALEIGDAKGQRMNDVRRNLLDSQKTVAEQIGLDTGVYDRAIILIDSFVADPSVDNFTLEMWLALGGRWLLAGQPQEEIDRQLAVFAPARNKKAAAGRTRAVKLFVKPAYELTQQEYLEVAQKYRGTTKAGDLPVVEALDEIEWRQKQEARRQNAAKIRNGFDQTYSSISEHRAALTAEGCMADARSFTENWGAVLIEAAGHDPAAADRSIGELTGPNSFNDFGRFQVYARLACEKYVAALPVAVPLRERLMAHLAEFFNGKEMTVDHYMALRGDHDKTRGGDLGDLAEAAGIMGDDAKLEMVAAMGALIDQAYLIGLVLQVSNKNQLINVLSTYCDAILNIHEFDYPPYMFHYLSTNGFGFGSDYFRYPEKRRKMYELSFRHYKWIHDYMRALVLSKTDLKDKGAEYVEDILGDYTQGRTSILNTQEGVSVSPEEVFWENVCALRDLIVLVHDRYGYPVVVKDVDPAAIGMDRDACEAIGYRQGNTTTLTLVAEQARLHSEGVRVRDSGGRELNVGVSIGMTPYPCAMPDKRPGRTGESVYYAPVSLTFLDRAQLKALGAEGQASADPRGTFTVLKFKTDKRPVVSFVMNHFTSQQHTTLAYENAGLPVAWANVAERMMYMKVVLPEILQTAGVEVIPQIDILRGTPRQQIEAAIKDFVRKGGMRVVISKPSEQSGGRGAERFVVITGDEAKDRRTMRDLVNFVYDFSKGDDVVIQIFLTSSPQVFATDEFLTELQSDFAEKGRAVELNKIPQTPLYWYMRTFPTQSDGTDKAIAGWLLIVNTEAVANYGRGGVGFEGTPERVLKPEFAGIIRQKMEEVTYKCLDAIEQYAPTFVDDMLERFTSLKARYEATHQAIPEYVQRGIEQFTQLKAARKADAGGVSYARMINGLFDYIPYLTYNGKMVHFEPALDPQGEMGIVLYIYDEDGNVHKIPSSQEKILEALRKGTMEMGMTVKIGVIELNSGFGLVGPHQQQLEKLGMQINELTGPICDNMAKRGIAYLGGIGMADNLRTIEPVAEAGDDPVNQAAAAAMQNVHPVNPDDISLVLISYAARRIQDKVGTITPQTQPAQAAALVELAAKTLDEERAALQERLRESSQLCGAGPVPLALRGKWSQDFARRISELAVERLMYPSRPVVRVYDKTDRLSIDDFGKIIGDRANVAVVCGTLDGFTSELSALIADSTAADGGVLKRNVLGILWNKGWIQRKRNKIFVYRAIVYDRENKTLKEVAFPRPVILDADRDVAMTTNIPAEFEMQIARDISRQMALCNVLQINPFTGAFRAYDKALMYRAMAREGINIPRTVFIPRTEAGNAEGIEAAVTEFVGREKRLERSEVVVKPNASTEARGVGAFTDTASARTHTQKLLSEDNDVLLQSSEGTSRYFDQADGQRGHRRLILRVNVAWDGNAFIAESGYAQVAASSNDAIVSKSRGAAIVDINKALQNIYYRNRNGQWVRLALTPEHIAAIKRTAQHSALVIDRNLGVEEMLKLIGIDIVLNVSENEGGDVEFVPVVLEGNARPAGLNSSVLISDAPVEADYTPEFCATRALWGYTRAEVLRSRPQDIDAAVSGIAADRPEVQTESIQQQLGELTQMAIQAGFETQVRTGLGIGVAGPRRRDLGMHPDMDMFYGPAGQRPLGAGKPEGREQICVFVQASNDNKIHLNTGNPQYQQSPDWIWANQFMYPGDDVRNVLDYGRFGTAMSEKILASLGYYSDGQLEEMKRTGQDLPPKHMWASNNMRRTVCLAANAIASLRTLKDGPEGEMVQAAIGAGNFRGLRICLNGEVPQGGFSTSSAVTVAILNAINAYYDLRLSDDTIIDIARQAEYGTGVKAGALDHTAIQKGVAGQTMLISSNPSQRYKTIRAFELDAERFNVVFPYSVARDVETSVWSGGMYAPQTAAEGKLTSKDVRNMTGKSAYMAAVLLNQPLDRAFFEEIEEDLVSDGQLDPENLKKVYENLRRLPALIPLGELRSRIEANRDWHIGELMRIKQISRAQAAAETDGIFTELFRGWHDPLMSRTDVVGQPPVMERGVPLRAMLAYLYGEEAKNLYMLYHQDSYIEYVSRSQWGDRSFDIDFDSLPTREEMEQEQPLSWETESGRTGAQLMEEWLRRFRAAPFNYNRGLDDASLDAALGQIAGAVREQTPVPENIQLHRMEGSNFFRGLALIDLIEAMLKKAFDDDAVAVRVNAAGQGDFFQVHIDSTKANIDEVKHFIEKAVYKRFGLRPTQKFVDTYPGGPAIGIQLDRIGQVAEVSAAIARHITAAPGRHAGATQGGNAMELVESAI